MNRRRKRTWPACLSVMRTFMPTKPLYTVTIVQNQMFLQERWFLRQDTHLVCDSHLSQLPPTRVVALPMEQCMLEVDTCRMTACRRGLLPHWHIACHCWMQLSAWEPSCWTSQTVYKLRFFAATTPVSLLSNSMMMFKKLSSIEFALRARKINV